VLLHPYIEGSSTGSTLGWRATSLQHASRFCIPPQLPHHAIDAWATAACFQPCECFTRSPVSRNMRVVVACYRQEPVLPVPDFAAPKQRVQSCVVDVPNLDIKLDGKATKLEQLLSLAPWYKPQPAAVGQPVIPAEEADLAALNSSSSGAAGGVEGGGSRAQAGKKKPKIPRVLELNVKAAAVLHGREPPVMPPGLLQWALEVRGWMLPATILLHSHCMLCHICWW